MFPYKKYLVKETDKFDPQQFSFVIDDMEIIRKQTKEVSSSYKTEIIISFLKNQSLENKWVEANPVLTELVKSGSLTSSNIESLFQSSSSNPHFRKQMEEFLTKGLSE
jgi:hypothetical protein